MGDLEVSPALDLAQPWVLQKAFEDNQQMVKKKKKSLSLPFSETMPVTSKNFKNKKLGLLSVQHMNNSQ